MLALEHYLNLISIVTELSSMFRKRSDFSFSCEDSVECNTSQNNEKYILSSFKNTFSENFEVNKRPNFKVLRIHQGKERNSLLLLFKLRESSRQFHI